MCCECSMPDCSYCQGTCREEAIVILRFHKPDKIAVLCASCAQNTGQLA